MNTWNGAELDLYNRLIRNPGHTHCDFIIKSSYKDASTIALYCLTHDFFLGWVSYDHIFQYQRLGINKVKYTDGDYFGVSLVPSNSWAYKGRTPCGFKKPDTIKVKNLRSGKKTDLWVGFEGNNQRDPSMPEYWKFIDSFK